MQITITIGRAGVIRLVINKFNNMILIKKIINKRFLTREESYLSKKFTQYFGIVTLFQLQLQKLKRNFDTFNMFMQLG